MVLCIHMFIPCTHYHTGNADCFALLFVGMGPNILISSYGLIWEAVPCIRKTASPGLIIKGHGAMKKSFYTFLAFVDLPEDISPVTRQMSNHI